MGRLGINAVPTSDARSHLRRPVVRTAVLHSRERAQLCLIRDVSAQGLRAKVFRPLAADARIEVEFARLRAPAKVVWERDGEVGLSFDSSDDLDAVLTPKANSVALQARAPRIAVEVACALQINGQTVGAQLTDISQSGVRVVAKGRMVAGDSGVLLVPGRGPVNGWVRWLAGGAMGMEFHDRLGIAELEAWLETRCITGPAEPRLSF